MLAALHRPLQRRLALAAALLFLGCMSPGADPADSAPAALDVGCRLTPVPPLVAGGPVELRFELANRGPAPVWVLRWNTPLEGFRGTLLRVTRDGEEVPYQGPRTKRGDPGRADYVEIPAGGSTAATVDLAVAYDLGAPGRYRVEVAGGLVDATSEASAVPRPRDRHQPLPLRCEPAELSLSPAAPPPAPAS